MHALAVCECLTFTSDWVLMSPTHAECAEVLAVNKGELVESIAGAANLSKTDAESAALNTVLHDEVIPSALRSYLDITHLDPRSLSFIYALRELIRETQTGKLRSNATSVLVALSSELDFFWQRITRGR